MIEILRKEGVKVHYIEERVQRPKMYFTRDQAVVLRGGAVVGRMALDIRRGEEVYVHRKLASLDIPIYRVVGGYGYFEGGNLIYLDRNTVLIGEGLRTNEEGVEQVIEVLYMIGYEEVIRVPLAGYYKSFPSGYVHIDVGLNIPDHNICVVYPEALPYYIIEELMERKFEIIEVPRDEALRMATNFLPIRPGRVVAVEGNRVTCKKMERYGIDVIEVDVDELIKGGGGIRCMTLPIDREVVWDEE
jgi:N-dimethylarginine dimethylaminohydrolase